MVARADAQCRHTAVRGSKSGIDDPQTGTDSTQIPRTALLSTPAATEPQNHERELYMTQFHDLTMADINGNDVDFSTYNDQLCLVVNVASR